MPRQIKSLSFSFVRMLTLLFAVVVYRYDEECSEAVPNCLKLKSVSNFVIITRWSVPPGGGTITRWSVYPEEKIICC